MTPELTIRSFSNDQMILDKIFYTNHYRIQILPENCVVLDVGAHCGYFSLNCAMKGAKRVYAFEPYKPNYEMLLKNVSLFRDIVVPFNVGMWYDYCVQKLAHPDMDNKFYDFNEIKFNPKGDFDQGLFVPFDTMVGQLPEQPNFLKLHTRNYDLELLKGSNKIKDFEFVCGEAYVEGPEDIKSTIEAMKEKGFEQSFFRANDEEGTNQFVFGKDKAETESIFSLYA